MRHVLTQSAQDEYAGAIDVDSRARINAQAPDYLDVPAFRLKYGD